MESVDMKKTVNGITRGGFPWWLINHRPPGKVLVVLSEDEDVLDFVEDTKALFKIGEDVFPSRLFGVAGYAEEEEADRQVSLFNWACRDVDVLVTSLAGLDLEADKKGDLQKKTCELRPGSVMTRKGLEDLLQEGGYARADRVEQVGEYAIRGEVVDIWSPGYAFPRRVTWILDSVEGLRPINLYTQRSEGFERETTIYPVRPGTNATLRNYLTSDTFVILFSQFNGLTSAPGGVPSNDSPLRTSQGPLETAAPLNFESAQVIHVLPDPDETGEIEFLPPPAFSGHLDLLRTQLKKWDDEDWSVVIFCHNQGERDRLEELLDDPSITIKGKSIPWWPHFVIGELEHGFLHPSQRLAVLTNSEIFGRYRKRIRLPKFEGGQTISSFMDIKTGDFLVHERHGIGRYLGLTALKVAKVSSEFLAIEYKGGDKVYVPVFEIQQVQKYLGAEGSRPALSSLDTATWERIKSKVKEDVAKLAADLLNKAAKRSIRPGYAFPAKNHLEEEFAQSFIYELTEDQRKTLEEVERDMTSPRPMDRLICGDVGFGKTEIGMRAALKCALAGKQAVLLCPTTILAEQHFRNFSERMADYPVTLQLLSRFQTKLEQKKILEAVKKGGVDIVIGTHRLLSSDVHLKALGLMIIDEEHRFGVRQKNKLLALRETSDVLSMTATPIPRTLASSLGGIKDLSVIETAPEGRLPISTYAGEFNEEIMVKAVQSELDRGGQVFYVHNRVKTLTARKEWLESLIPNLRISMAHGQMKEEELERAMHDFLHKKIDILLSTTIIESGLDIPTVNTLIVEEAEEMGLAQLYQLRGRVGRSRTRAYCYLFYSMDNMTSDARKRLEALKEFTALGSGLRLAMRDMEIRGAGNLLGPQQHGNMAAVGVETYSRLLNEEIQKQKGEAVAEDFGGPLLELSLSAYIPDDYLPSEAERVNMYKRILSADVKDLEKLKEELIDRCGPLPAVAKTLFDAAFLRMIMKERGVSEVHEEMDGLLIYFRSNFTLPEKSFSILLSQSKDMFSFIAGPPAGVRVKMPEDENPLDTLGRFLRVVFPAEGPLNRKHT